MRHGKKFNHLGRKTAHRKAMLSNMACSLIEHKRINTTVAKAKALRKFVEPLITKSKTDSTHSRRTVFSYLRDKHATAELFREVAPKIADRPGGYTRIIKTGNRLGDNAEMCLIELVDFNEMYTGGKSESAGKSKRRRRGGKKGGDAKATTEATSAGEVTEAAVVEETAEDKAVEAPVMDEATTEEATETATEETAEEAAPEAAAEEASEESTEEAGDDSEEEKKDGE